MPARVSTRAAASWRGSGRSLGASGGSLRLPRAPVYTHFAAGWAPSHDSTERSGVHSCGGSSRRVVALSRAGPGEAQRRQMGTLQMVASLVVGLPIGLYAWKAVFAVATQNSILCHRPWHLLNGCQNMLLSWLTHGQHRTDIWTDIVALRLRGDTCARMQAGSPTANAPRSACRPQTWPSSALNAGRRSTLSCELRRMAC